MSYDPDLITRYFDEYGIDEWERLISSPKNLISLQIHQHYLAKYIDAGKRVLELGAGAGRYTIFLADLGATIVTSDISPVQLDLNRKHVSQAGKQDQVEDFLLLDITDLSQLADDSFDVVVAIGGPLSYTLDRRDVAMNEILRVVKPGGMIFLGVMSRYGGMQRLVANYVDDLIKGDRTITTILQTGDDLGYLAFEGHHHHMFTHTELRNFLSNFPVDIVETTSTSYLSIQKGKHLAEIVRDKQAWKTFFEMELTICKEVVDGGTHMLAIVKKHQ